MTIIKTNSRIENSVRDNYIKALKDEDFKKLIAKLNIDEKEIMKNTTALENTVSELRNCKNCKGLVTCQNKQLGCVNYPKNYNNHLIFSYEICKYKKKKIKDDEEKETAEKQLEHASIKDIDTKDKNRYPAIKWITNFIKEYNPNKKNKGLYLHGNFGCGKTYFIACLFNELKKKGYQSEIVYFPTILRELKTDFETMNNTIDYLCNVELLLIDDIGAEKVTEWTRDEILGTILQERMNNNKTTFFTSNLDIKELETHLSNNGIDKIKSNRIIERIKQLTEDIEMISINRRN